MYTPINNWTKDAIIKHLAKEFRGKSMNESGDCRYYGPEGRRCAVGLFIGKDVYDPKMEGEVATDLIRKYDLETIMPLDGIGMERLQEMHDITSETECLIGMIQWVEDNVN